MTCSGGIYPPQSVQIYAPSGGCRCIAVAVNVCSTGHCAVRRVSNALGAALLGKREASPSRRPLKWISLARTSC
jgi:hypothetical protein